MENTSSFIYDLWKEHKGIQPMVDLFSIKARQGLATHLKMGMAVF